MGGRRPPEGKIGALFQILLYHRFLGSSGKSSYKMESFKNVLMTIREILQSQLIHALEIIRKKWSIMKESTEILVLLSEFLMAVRKLWGWRSPGCHIRAICDCFPGIFSNVMSIHHCTQRSVFTIPLKKENYCICSINDQKLNNKVQKINKFYFIMGLRNKNRLAYLNLLDSPQHVCTNTTYHRGKTKTKTKTLILSSRHWLVIQCSQTAKLMVLFQTPNHLMKVPARLFFNRGLSCYFTVPVVNFILSVQCGHLS